MLQRLEKEGNFNENHPIKAIYLTLDNFTVGRGVAKQEVCLCVHGLHTPNVDPSVKFCVFALGCQLDWYAKNQVHASKTISTVLIPQGAGLSFYSVLIS